MSFFCLKRHKGYLLALSGVSALDSSLIFSAFIFDLRRRDFKLKGNSHSIILLVILGLERVLQHTGHGL